MKRFLLKICIVYFYTAMASTVVVAQESSQSLRLAQEVVAAKTELLKAKEALLESYKLNAEYSSKLKWLTAERSDMDARLTYQQASADKLKSSLDIGRRDNEEVMTKLAQSLQRNAELERSLSESREKTTSLTEQLNSMRSEHFKRAEVVETMKRRMDELYAAIEDGKKHNARLEEENSKYAERLARREDDKVETEKLLELGEKSVALLNEKLASAEAEIQKLVKEKPSAAPESSRSIFFKGL